MENRLAYCPERRKYFNDFCFFLSHDVDRIDTYTLYEMGYKLKEVFRLCSNPHLTN